MGNLTLTRWPGDGVTLTLPDGRRIEVTVMGLDARGVRLKVAAPRDVRIDRADQPLRRPGNGQGEGDQGGGTRG